MRAAMLISNVLARICMMAGRIAAWTLIPLMLVIVSDVVLRRYFVIGSVKLQEAEWHLHAILFMFCLAYAYLAQAHVRIELVSEGLSDKARAVIELIGGLVFLLPLCWILTDYSIDLVVRSFNAGESSPHPSGLPYRWLIKTVMPLGFVLLALSGVSAILRSVILVFGSPDLQAEVRDRMLAERRRLDDA